MKYFIGMQSALENCPSTLTFSTDTFVFPLRVDSLISKCFESKGVSREKIKRYIKEGYLACNGEVCTNPSKKVVMEDMLSFILPEESSSLLPEEGDVEVLHEDEDFLLLNKPASIVVHPCSSSPHGTLLQRLLFHYPELSAMGGERPAIVHRLDKDTTGLLLIARNEHSRCILAEAFARRKIEKYYLAFVDGITPEKGVINTPIGRDLKSKTKMTVLPKGKEAYTSFTTLYTTPVDSNVKASLILVKIRTGRTHQIRVHLASIGFPIIGDSTYNTKSSRMYAKRPMLHAYHIAFTHPKTEESYSYTLNPPVDFAEFFIACKRHSKHVVITGSAGSGKSTVTEYFTNKGIPSWSADTVVKELYKEGNSLWYYIRQSYGNKFLNENQTIDTSKLLSAMKEAPAFATEIERVVHSFIAKDLHLFWEEHCTASYTVAEVPLYYESSFSTTCTADIVLFVLADATIRVERMKKLQWADEKIQYVLENQLDDMDKAEKASYIINNEGSTEQLYIEIEKAIHYIENISTQDKIDILESFQTILNTIKIS